MTRGWARTLASISMLPLLAAVGCDSSLTVRSFAGTIGEFTFDGITAQTVAPNQHLELWARTQYNDIVRLDGYTNLNEGKTAFGFMIRQAISLDNPCMIDSYLPQPGKTAVGNLLTSPAAYTDAVQGGVMQTAQEQAQQIVDRIHQLSDDPTIQTGGPLLAITPYDPTPLPSVPPNATPEARKAACDQYLMTSANPYIPNPYQITTPLRGTAYGFVKFISLTPPSNYDGFRIDMPINLQGVQEIFFTLEGATVDAKNRGPLFLTSTLTQGGRDVVHFNLAHADPNSTASGTAALLVDLDQDPVQF